MSIPLVQNNEKDSINTSIIAIKRQIERINALLGLSNSEEIDTSVFATKTELEDAVTQVETDLAPVDEVTADNMQSVTSNAVYQQTQLIDEWSDNGVYLKKVGRIVTIAIRARLNSSSPVNLTTIPSRFRPTDNYVRIAFISNSSDVPCGQVVVNQSGKIDMYLSNGGTFPDADYVACTAYIV